VRNQFRVLRREVEQRKAEMYAEIEARIAEHFRSRDEERANLQWQLHEITERANAEIEELLKDRLPEGMSYRHHFALDTPRVSTHDVTKIEMRTEMVKALEAQVKGALLRLDRDEADLLRYLAVGALESHEARQFLGSIPSVGELVPAARLAEIEAQFEENAEEGR
jgi:hypothetical protein